VAVLATAASVVVMLSLVLASANIVLREDATRALIGVGMVIGFSQGARPVMARAAGGVTIRGGGWVLLLPALAVALFFAAVLTEDLEPMVYALGLVYVGTAAGLAACALLLLRRLFMRGASHVPAAAEPVPPPPPRPSPRQPALASCPACGRGVQEDWRFCRACGARLKTP
jgi:hypothetical protein